MKQKTASVRFRRTFGKEFREGLRMSAVAAGRGLYLGS